MDKVITAVHHAGGSSRAFIQLRRALRDDVAFTALDLAGHGRRAREPHFGSLEHAAHDVAASVRGDDGSVILGVSMGALVAHRAVQILEAEGSAPGRLIVVSANAPKANTARSMRELQPFTDDRPNSGPHSGAARALLITDLSAVTAYRPQTTSVATPIEVWLGAADPTVTAEAAAGWIALSTANSPPRVRTFEGGHLFLSDAAGAVRGAEVFQEVLRELRA